MFYPTSNPNPQPLHPPTWIVPSSYLGLDGCGSPSAPVYSGSSCERMASSSPHSSLRYIAMMGTWGGGWHGWVVLGWVDEVDVDGVDVDGVDVDGWMRECARVSSL